MSDITKQVTEFHKAFGFPVRTEPTVATREEVDARLRMTTEEFLELLEACGVNGLSIELIQHVIAGAIRERVDFVNLTDAADALGDLDYINEGTRLTLGIQRAPVADEIHRSNMAKVGGKVVDGKLQKPDGWKPPNIKRIIWGDK